MHQISRRTSVLFRVIQCWLIAECAQFTPTTGASFYSRAANFAPTYVDGEESNNHTSNKKAPTGAIVSMGSEAQVGSMISYHDGVLFASLANNNKIPLIGMGVGNSPHQYVSALVSEALHDDLKTRLIDTSHASHNEGLVAEGIIKGAQEVLKSRNLRDPSTSSSKRSSSLSKRKVEVHVVTKVWYTHLGYERTKLSVQESLRELAPAIQHDQVDLKIHLLLHWPRCFAQVDWMDCEQEEANLPDHVKATGPDPSDDPTNAWKESWKYLEDIHLSDQYPIASIGVSNFHLHDMEVMDSFARIHPHVLQVNIWSLLYDSMLVNYCHKHRIHVQVYNTMSNTILKDGIAPRAHQYLHKVATQMTQTLASERGDDTSAVTPVTVGQVLLSWLIQHGVSVIPRTNKLARLRENSATALMEIPAMTDVQVETVAHAVEAYLSNQDFEKDIHVTVTFHVVNKDIMLYWVGRDGREVRIAHVPQGTTFHETTYPNHIFRTYDASNKDIYIEHEIQANFGDHKDIHVEL